MEFKNYNHNNSCSVKTSKNRNIKLGGTLGEFTTDMTSLQTPVVGKTVFDSIVGGVKNKRGGRGIITDITIPVVFLYANNTIGKKKYRKSIKLSKSSKSRKSNKSRKYNFSRKNK